MTKVKICGITNRDDALEAIDAAQMPWDLISTIEARGTLPSAAREIIEVLPEGIAKIGVFVNESIDEVIDISSIASLDAIQLHGDEPTAFVGELKERCGLDVIKAFRVTEGFVSDATIDYDVEGVLLDGFATNARGGTGATFDWVIAKRVRSLVQQLWLAGGLSPENVRAAILEVNPYAVDACSSLESRPGIKDHEKLRDFIKEAKAV